MRIEGKIVATILIFSLFFSSNLFGEEKVRLTNGEWEPFMSEKLTHYGILSHIVSEAFDTVGIKVEYGFNPWKRSLYLAEKGTWDGSVLWALTPNREKIFYFSEPVYDTCTMLFHLKNYKFDWESEDDLQDIKIGVTMGYADTETFDNMKKAGKRITYETAPTDLLNFRKLSEGRIQIFTCNKDVGLKIISKNFQNETTSFIYHPKPINCQSLCVVFGKNNNNNKKLLESFNKGLANLRENGKYDLLIDDFRNGKYDK